MKKIALMLMVFMLLTIGAAAVGHAETPVLEREAEVQTFSSAEDVDNDVLFGKYAEQFFTDRKVIMRSIGDGRLQGSTRSVYLALRPMIAEVAEGNRSSTAFEIPFEDVGMKTVFTAEELGVAAIIVDGAFADDALQAASQYLAVDFAAIVKLLLANAPYELYWYDKTAGVQYSTGGFSAYYDPAQGDYVLEATGGYSFSFSVAEGYAAGTFMVDSTPVTTAKNAAANAREIVSSYASAGDYEKLLGYKNEICALADYNHSAADDESTAYGDPWQLIWVFDGDASTRVVCEGYAKAFQYLCDQSSFSDSLINCYSVTGTMSGGTGAGAHMWNLVRMQNGKVYLADVTNCDAETIGADDLLFLAGYDAGDWAQGYVFQYGGISATYVYDAETTRLYTETELTVSDTDYVLDDQTPIGDDSQKCGNSVAWRFEDGVLTISGTGDMWDRTDEMRAANQWLWPDDIREQIQKVVIQNGVTSIGIGAFEDMGTVSEVILPDSLRVICDSAFARCTSLESIDLPEGLLSIQGAFIESGLRSVTIPGTVGFLGSFGLCTNLTSVLIKAYTGDDYTIVNGCFAGCPNLEYIEVENGHMALRSDEGVLYSGDTLISYPQGKKSAKYHVLSDCTNIGQNAFYFVDGPAYLKEIVLPESITEIPACAFQWCRSLSSVVIPETVTSIGNFAFDECALGSISIPASVTSIGLGAFNHCDKLIQIEVSGNNPAYASLDGVLFNKGLDELVAFPGGRSSIDIPEGVTSIKDGVFFQCYNLERITLPESVTSIGNQAFSDCVNLAEINIPESVTSIGFEAFDGCTGLSEIQVPGSVQQIRERTFFLCTGLETVRIMNGVTDIAEAAFQGCSALSEIEIPDSVAHIGERAFCGTNLTRIRIPESVVSIGQEAFSTSGNLNIIVIEGLSTDIGENAFAYCSGQATIYGHAGSTAEAYALNNGIAFKILDQGWEAPTYTWADDNTEVTATRISSYDIGLVETETVPASGEVTLPPTCEEMGETTYTSAEFANEAFSVQSKTVANLDPIGHDWGEPAYVWSEDNAFVTATRICRHDNSHVETETVPATGEVTLPPTTESMGETTYTSAAFENEAFAIQTKTVADVEALSEDPIDITAENFPDPAFRAYAIALEESYGNGDGAWTSDEISQVQEMNVSNKGIQSLQGIEHFSALVNLECHSNPLTTLDLSGNPALKELFCYETQLTTLNVSGNPALEVLSCKDNSLTALDLSGNPMLQHVDCGGNQLTELNLIGNASLRQLYCDNNRLTALDLSHNPEMQSLGCNGNQLSALDVSALSRLEYLGCHANRLTELDVSNNASLEKLACYGNEISVLDISENPRIVQYVNDEHYRLLEDNTVRYGDVNFDYTDFPYLWCDDTVWIIGGSSVVLDSALDALATLKLPGSIREIDDESFTQISMQAVLIPEGCTKIGSKAFAHNPQLLYVRIPASVTDIAGDAFEGCPLIRIDYYQ